MWAKRAKSRQDTWSGERAAAALLWINRGLEVLWLLTVILVPLAFLGRNNGEWSSIIGSFELPKIVLLRTLAGLMAALWIVEWLLRNRSSLGTTITSRSAAFRPATWPGRLGGWLRGQPTRWLIAAVALYLGSTLLSTALSASSSLSLWGDVPGQDSYGAYTVVAYVLLFAVIVTHLRTPDQLLRLMSAVVLMGMLLAGYAMFQHYDLDFLDLMESPSTTRVTSTMGGAVFTAAVLLMTIPVTLMAATVTLGNSARTSGLWWKGGLWVVVLTIQLLGIIFSFSRGPWVGTASALAGLIFLFGVFVGWRYFARAALLLALAVALTWVVIQLPSPSERREPTGEVVPIAPTTAAVSARFVTIGREAAEGGLSGRRKIWDTSWTLMRDHPWVGFDDLDYSSLRPVIGYGPDLFRAAFLLKSKPGAQNQIVDESAHAHNFFVHQGVELGFLGLATSFLVFVVLFVVGGYQILLRRSSYSSVHKLVLVGLLAILAGRFLEQLVGVARVSDLTIFWVLLAVFVALPTLEWAREPARDTPAREPRPFMSSGQLARPKATNRYARWQGSGLMVVAAGLIIAIALLTWMKSVNYLRAAIIADEGAAHFRNGELRDALSSIDRAIDLAPDVSTYYAERVGVYTEIKSSGHRPQIGKCGPQTSESSYDLCLEEREHTGNLRWVERRPFSYRSRLALADSTLNLGLLKQDPTLVSEATQLYQDAKELVPRSWPLLIGMASIYIDLGQPEAALPLVDESLAIVGATRNAATAHVLRGKAYRDLGQPVKAQEALGIALRFDPDSAPAYYVRGAIFAELGQRQRAIEDLDKAIQRDTTSGEAYYARGTTYYELSRYGKAIEDLEQAIGLEPEFPKAYNNRGLAYARLGQFERAIEDFDRAILLDPLVALAFNNRGFTYRDSGEPDKAIEDLDRAILMDPQLALAYYNRALAFTLVGRDLEAGRDIERAAELGLETTLLSKQIEEIKEGR